MISHPLDSQTKARDKESRLWYQTMKEFRKIKSDLRTKETSISDQHKKIIELDAELSDSHHAYEVSIFIIVLSEYFDVHFHFFYSW